MTDKEETRSVEIPKDAIAIEATGTALGMVAQLLTEAPDQIKPYIDQEIAGFVQQLMPRLAALMAGGAFIAYEDDWRTLADAFDEAFKAAQEIPEAKKTLTPAVRQIAADIAAVADKGIASLQVTAQNEQYYNNDAYLDAIAGHALLMRGIVNLTNVPEDYTKSDRVPATKH